MTLTACQNSQIKYKSHIVISIVSIHKHNHVTLALIDDHATPGFVTPQDEERTPFAEYGTIVWPVGLAGLTLQLMTCDNNNRA